MKCKNRKAISQFNYKNRGVGRRHARCKTCTRADVRSAYKKNREHYLKYRIERNRMLRENFGRFIRSYLLEHPCIECGNSDPRVLHFDHVKGIKLANVSLLRAHGANLEYVKREIEKCVVRCANCHAVKTATELGYYRYLE